MNYYSVKLYRASNDLLDIICKKFPIGYRHMRKYICGLSRALTIS